jgi:hypothetical protein
MATNSTNVWIPSPYLICPHPVLSSEESLLAECIRNLAFPPDYETDPYWETPVGHDFALTRQIVCGQFYRDFIDKNFQHYKMPRHWRKEVKKHFSSQAELMGQIWRIVKLLPLSHNPRPLVFHEIILEQVLIFCHAWTEEEGSKSPTATEWLKSQQGLNRKLQALKNPFDPKVEPETWSFIEEARRTADRNNDFCSDYRKLIRARMSMVTVLRESHPKKITQSGKSKENRGRKSISSSRKPST